MTNNPVNTVSPGTLLPTNLAGITLGAVLHSTAVVATSAGGLTNLKPTPAQHTLSSRSDLLVTPLLHSGTSLTLVRGGLLPPLTCTDVRSVNTLRVHTASSLGADRKALAGTEKATATAIPEHTGALLALRRLLGPPSPGDRTTSASTASVSHYIRHLDFF